MHGIKNCDYLMDSTQAVLHRLVSSAPFLHNYVFVGGSATALHLRHRLSEDLDFFTWDSSLFDVRQIQAYLADWSNKQVLNISEQQIDLVLDGVKVTFFNAGWPFLQPSIAQPFNLASLNDLAAMKVHVLFIRAKYRDYYDLYWLVRELGLAKVYSAARQVVDGLTPKLFFIALTYIDDVQDDSIAHLKPAERISKQQIRQYFEQQITHTELDLVLKP